MPSKHLSQKMSSSSFALFIALPFWVQYKSENASFLSSPHQKKNLKCMNRDCCKNFTCAMRCKIRGIDNDFFIQHRFCGLVPLALVASLRFSASVHKVALLWFVDD